MPPSTGSLGQRTQRSVDGFHELLLLVFLSYRQPQEVNPMLRLQIQKNWPSKDFLLGFSQRKEKIHEGINKQKL